VFRVRRVEPRQVHCVEPPTGLLRHKARQHADSLGSSVSSKACVWLERTALELLLLLPSRRAGTSPGR
jgi:hypothetical protein